MANLGFDQKLQIKIFTNAQQNPPSDAAGVISFDQATQRVGINGVWYDKVGDLVSTGILGATGTSTVADLLTQLQTEINTINNNIGEGSNIDGRLDALETFQAAAETTHSELATSISGVSGAAYAAQQTADSKVSSVDVSGDFLGISGSPTGGYVISTTDGLSTAVTNANSALQHVTLIAGGTENVFSATGTNSLYGKIDGKNIYLDDSLENPTSIKDAFETLTSGNLAQVISDIETIKKELSDPQGTTGLATILDNLQTLYGGVTGHTFDVTNATGVNTLQKIIDGLESQITANSVADQGYADGKANTAETNAKSYADGVAGTAENNAKDFAATGINNAVSSLTGATGDTASDLTLIGLSKKIDDAQQAATDAGIETTVVMDGVTGAQTAGTQGYIMVTGTEASATGAGSFLIQTTDALDTELAKVNNVISWEVINS